VSENADQMYKKLLKDVDNLKDFFELNNISPAECLPIIVHFTAEVLEWLDTSEEMKKQFVKIIKKAILKENRMQKVMLVGNLGRDPEEKSTFKGLVLTMSMAVKVNKDVTQWYKLLIWEDKKDIFKSILPYLKKGSRLLVIGDLMKPGLYVNKAGETMVDLSVSPSSINFIGTQQDKEKASESNNSQSVFSASNGTMDMFESQEEDLPF
jgi:single-strand DNA-binding protein